jgi:hypothetical protein
MSHDWMRFCFNGKLDQSDVWSKIQNKDLFDNEDEDGEFVEDSFHLTQLSEDVFPNRKTADKYFAKETKWDGDNEGWFYYYTKKDGSIVTIVEAVSEHY